MKKSIRNQLVLMLFCGSAFSTVTASEIMRVIFYDQSIRTFELSERPSVNFRVDGLEIVSSSMATTLPCKYSEIERIEFNTDAEIVTDVKDFDSQHKSVQTFRYVDTQCIEVTGVSPHVRVSLYALDGRMFPLDLQREENRLIIHLRHLLKGFYILQIDNQTYKIQKK